MNILINAVKYIASCDKVVAPTIDAHEEGFIKKMSRKLLYLNGMTLAAILIISLVLLAVPAQATVAILDGWTNKINNTNASPQSFTYTPGMGTNRLLLVAITTKYGSAATRTYSAAYGGKSLTMIAQYNTGRDNTWVGYLKEADIASRSSNTIQVTCSGSPSNTKVFVATYQNIDQSSPITDANRNGNNNTSNTSISFGRNITTANGDQLFYVAHSGSATASQTPPAGYTELLEHTGNGLSVSVGHRNSTVAGSENQTVSFSAAGRVSLVVASLNDAINTCTAFAPSVSITPASQTITTNGGSTTYSVTVRNNDTGTGCSNVIYSLSPSDSNTTVFNISTLGVTSVTVAPGSTSSAIVLTVSAKSGQSAGLDTTTVTASASGHANGSNSVTTTLNVPTTCMAAAPTVSMTPSSQTITSNGGSVNYTLNVKNNDSGSGCSNTSFNLALTDSDSTGLNFVVPSVLSAGSITLAPGANTNVTITVRAKTGVTTGTNFTSVTATAAGHANATSNVVTTVINIASLGGPEPAGWFAGDMHVHRSCGGSPEAIPSIYQKMSAQNLSVISLLADMGNGEVQNPVTDLPHVNGNDDSVSTPGRIVHWDAEWHWDATYNQYPHQALGGHVVALGLTEAHQIWEEYTYPIYNWAHQQNAIAGVVHMQYLDDGIPQSLNCCTPIEYPVEVALGSADFIEEDVNGSDSAIQAYYRLLNCGFRPGFAAGTDYPCGVYELGSLLTYVQVAEGQMTYRNWIEGIARGRTVISRNGHNEFLNVTVNNSATPGDEIKLTAAGSLPVTITWTANQNLSGTIELVQNGIVIASQQASASQGAPASLTTTVDFAKSGWLAARRMGSNGHQVHTGAVFVTINNAPIRASAADADFYVQWMDNLLTKTSPGGAWNSYFPTNLAAAQTRYQAAKTLYQLIKSEATALLMITTASLPDGALNLSYSGTLAASGGTTPYTWSIMSGALPTGLTLNASTGVISGTPTAVGTNSFTVQVTDSSNPAKTTSASLSITVSTQANYSIWSGTTVPGLVDGGPDNSVELGVKFRADSSGYLKGIRFYKASTNTGTHVANLWSSSGTLLASATFTGETASGWQQVLFSNPVAITANTVYVASYHANNGHYSADVNYFASNGVDSPPLHALANGVSGGNGVYAYGSSSSFPNQTWNSANYWVDVVFSATPPATLTSIIVTPASQTISTGATQQYTATGTYSDGSTQNITSQVMWASSSSGVATITSAGLATGISSGSTTISATMNSIIGGTNLTVQPGPLTITTMFLPGGILNIPYSSTLAAIGGTTPYTWLITSGTLPTGLTLNATTGVLSGTPTSTGMISLTVQVTDSSNPARITTKTFSVSIDLSSPILIISSVSNPFSGYYAEILRTEGFNEFDVKDISTVSSTVLTSYDVVILGEMALASGQVTMLNDWVNAGGHLIAMRPDKKLAGLLGLTDMSTTLANGYLLANTSSGPGGGIVNQTIQFHGTADRYTLYNGASIISTLYSTATTSTSNPAVTLRSVGTNGGQAAAFAYDLARSIVYTRQGNPAWSGQERDGQTPIRSDDLFYGAASFDPQPDWIDLNKVAIPQADEQQRLLANLIIRMNFDKKPLPRFSYFPRGLPAVVVMTGDDHNGSGTAGRFDAQIAMGPSGCSVENWECIRSTSYIYPDNSLSNSQAAAYNSAGFEVALHVNTNCADWSLASLATFYTDQISQWRSTYSSLPLPLTNRTHCIVWSDYVTQPQVELANGIRLDTNYYYWPPNWTNDRPGFFTGSGMPMRFAKADGTIIDVYQAVTQMTDESGQTYPYTIDTLLEKAIGPEGFYGAFTANMHTDSATSSGSDAIVSSALARNIPVISARQMLGWLDGRNASTFSSLNWNANTLSFSISVGQGAIGLTAMAPALNGLTVKGVSRNGSGVIYSTRTMKGISYAVFPAENGAYQVTYELDTTPPAVSAISPGQGASGVNAATIVLATFE